MELMKLLSKGDLLEKIGKEYNIDANQVQGVLSNMLPKVSEAISKNTSTEKGLNSFMEALKDHEEDDVDGMLSNIKNIDLEDGKKIINHILGKERKSHEQEASKITKVKTKDVNNIMNALGPIVMGLISNKNKKEYQSDVNNIVTSLLGESGIAKIATALIDKDKDGNIVDDILGSFLKK